ncbi:uncharacterized protein O3C94_014535 [Discoglossus pictus]
MLIATGLLISVLIAASIPASLPPQYNSDLEDARNALKEFINHKQLLREQHFTPSPTEEPRKRQAQQRGSLLHQSPEQHTYQSQPGTSSTVPSKKECAQDGCIETMCSEGRCTTEISVGESGTRCDPRNDQCAPELCCLTKNTLQFPVCVPFPAEGEQCTIQTSDLSKGFTVELTTMDLPQYCHCAEGLVCTNKGFNLISTCEKPDDVLDLTSYRGESLLQPIVYMDGDLPYDKDIFPWAMHNGHLSAEDLPRAAEESEKKAENEFKILGEDMVDHLEDESLQLEKEQEEPAEPSQHEFEELKQLANQMSQNLDPGIY